MASIREMKRVIQAEKKVSNAKAAYLAAKAALLSDDDLHDVETIITNVKSTRKAFILSVINFAKLAPGAFAFYKQLDELYQKSLTSPRIEELLMNHLMEVEIKIASKR